MKDYFNKSTLAKYYKDDKIIKGDFLFEENGIIFKPYNLDIQKEKIRINYSNISNISKWDTFGIIPNGMTILTKDDRQYKFVINRRNLIANLIKTYMIKANLNINKILVAYFSIDDKTTSIAKDISEKIGADIFEIKPKYPCKAEDFRSYYTFLKHTDKNPPPEMLETISNLKDYEMILLVFNVEIHFPKIINTFMESQDFSKKILIPIYISPYYSTRGEGAKWTRVRAEFRDEELKCTYPNYHWKKSVLLCKKENRCFIEYWLYYDFWYMYNSF